MFRRVVWVSVLLGWSSLGCGLREQPMLPDGGVWTRRARAAPEGWWAVRAAAAVWPGPRGRGGNAGSGRHRHRRELGRIDRGQLGRVAIAGGRVGAGGGGRGSDVPSCTPGGVCTAANPCHVGQTVCSASGVASCMDTGGRASERHRLRHEHGVQQRRVRRLRGGERLYPRQRRAERGRSSARRARPSAPKPVTGRTGRRAGSGWSARRGSA